MAIDQSSIVVIDEEIVVIDEEIVVLDEEPAVLDEAIGDDRPTNKTQPDGGVTITMGGTMPSGSEMTTWNTAHARADATDPSTMPRTVSRPLPGEKNHALRNKV